MRGKRLLLLLLLIALALMGNVSLQTTVPAASDISQTVTMVGQYGLLAWLIIRSEQRITEQQKAWREERRWLISLIMGVKPPTD